MVSSTLHKSIIFHRFNQIELMRQDVEQVNIWLHRPVSSVYFATHVTLSTVHTDEVFVGHQRVIESGFIVQAVLKFRLLEADLVTFFLDAITHLRNRLL